MLVPAFSLNAHVLPWAASGDHRFLLFPVFFWGAEYTHFQTQKELARTLSRLEMDSLTDPLTELGNRRDFYNFYNIAFLVSSAKKYPFALILADIDHFKNINDTFGQEVGNRVLCHVADLLQAQFHDTDKLYRWSGEEFLILMPRTTETEARQVLERMCEKLETTQYCEEQGKSISLTASFGLYEGSSAEN